MPSLLQQFGLDNMSVNDRLALAEALWDSVHDSMQGGSIAPEVQAELERRAALADADPSRGIPGGRPRRRPSEGVAVSLPIIGAPMI